MLRRDDIRNIAIIAHVDHGKTTLVDKLLQQSGTFRQNQHVATRVMDSGDLEREKGITIMAKNTAIHWHDIKINIVDTPGHADFGGEVERTLIMVDGVLLLVDAAEGPLPQTKFVLKKSLDLGLKPIVVINKIDRKDARPYEVLDQVFELFLSLGATDEQLDFPVIYTNGREGIAKLDLEGEEFDLTPLFDLIVERVPPPHGNPDGDFQMIVASVDWSDYLGRLAIGRVFHGSINVGDWVFRMVGEGVAEKLRISKLYTFDGLKRVETETARVGEIVAVAGSDDFNVGETLATGEDPKALDYVTIDEPTISMMFMVNDSPFCGREGKFVTSRNLRDRLMREVRTNVSMRIEETESPDQFIVKGRGELQMAILIETMRREGYEFQVSKPEVITKEVDGVLSEPVEHVVVDVDDEHTGTVIDMLGRRSAEMQNMHSANGSTRLEFLVPSRGLIGFRSMFMTETRGTGMLHQVFHGYQPARGLMPGRARGVIVAMEEGEATAYSLESTQERGQLFIGPGTPVYSGMIVGENARDEDILANVVKKKHLTNMRASGSEGAIRLETPLDFSLEQFIEYIDNDELLEITPKTIRMRKKILDHTMRQRERKRRMDMANGGS
ncbi:MAG: translational GTPase TypA [Bacteroidetes bacterium]|nr:translational GTPase TypA [Bacteroidota bacterium]